MKENIQVKFNVVCVSFAQNNLLDYSLNKRMSHSEGGYTEFVNKRWVNSLIVQIGFVRIRN